MNKAILLGLLKQRFGGRSRLAEAADSAAMLFRREGKTSAGGWFWFSATGPLNPAQKMTAECAICGKPTRF